MNREKLINQIMAEAERDGEPLTKEEAEEIAEMELNAKGMIPRGESETPQKSKRKPPKKDPEKVKIISEIYDFLLTKGYENVNIINEQREISFNDFSVTLIKHRTKKG